MDHDRILADIVGALKGELGAGYAAIGDFVEQQGTLLAKQAEHIATSRATGALRHDDELWRFFLDDLERNAAGMARSVVMLSALTIEKAWNAVAGVIWGAVRQVLGSAGVPDALLPATPPFRL